MEKNKIKDLKSDITSLKRSLNELNILKERWFSKKENLKKDISKLIGVVKVIKFKRDKSNKEVLELKKHRDQHNKEVQDLIKKFQELNKEKQKILKDKKITFDPADIIKKIEALEFKIETEGFSFEKEQGIMKQIKQFKKQLGDASEVQSLFKELKELSDKITETKRKAEEFHNKIKETIKTQHNYSEFIEVTKKINALKKEQEQAFKNFIDSKEKFSKVNEDLKKKLKEAKEIGDEIIGKNKRETDHMLEQKTREVEEKLKTGKKLTTQDLMVFQSNNRDSKK